jgi:hypothetical protein
VARSRDKNFVELNRGVTPFGILIQPDPFEKRFRGGVGAWPRLPGGGKGDEGQGTGVERGPARWWCRGLPKTVFERRTHQCLGATADRPCSGLAPQDRRDLSPCPPGDLAARGMQRRQRRATRRRLVSAFRRGWTLILVALLDHEPLPMATFLPKPWPTLSWSNDPSIVHDSGVLHDVAA